MGTMLSVKVSAKNQIAVPSAARRQLGIEPGDRLSVEVTDDAIVLRLRPEHPSERLRGLGASVWKDKDPVKYVRDLRGELDQ
jgi:AbrB family looped-hinge helix DNA binding protein